MTQRQVICTATRPLSLLDLTLIGSGSSSTETLGNATATAQLAERLGYRRIWYAEHHSSTGLSSASPEIVIAHVAAHTRSIRLGSGGVMLPNHAPLRIVEAFRLLEALHPDRIDLGLGRAPGTNALTALAMRRSREAMGGDDYPELLAELIAYDEGFPASHPFSAIVAAPADVRTPPIWLLGSSDFSGRLAASLGLGFAYAAHINLNGAIPSLGEYRSSFMPSHRWAEPHAILTVSVVVGESEEHACELALRSELFMLRVVTGQMGRYPTLDEARAHRWTPRERSLLASLPMSSIVGDAESVWRQIDTRAEETGADEVMVATSLPDPDLRELTLRALAHEAGLTPRKAAEVHEDDARELVATVK